MEAKTLSRRELLGILAALGASASAADAFAQVGAMTANGGKVIFENDKMRVIEHVGKTRLGVCGTGYHSHPPHLTIALTDIKAKVTLQGKEPFMAENKAGDLFWDPGGFHTVENVGSRDARSYLVELKA
ncbi:MAG: hypothetical protein ABI569_00815 [Casimicrobiaceae bacterium]